ncbi:MAG TPA: PadR family transcriptional regulator [Ktedonobacterales bacterium]
MFGKAFRGRFDPAFGWAGDGPAESEMGARGAPMGRGPWGFGGPGWDPERGPGWGPGWGPPPFRPFWGMGRRFPFGPGMGPRMFGRGDMKFALLDLLRDRPKHGYEMIKDLEERSGGFYTPSAGTIYPTLQLLEDRGWVTAQTADGKKVYAITDAGRQAADEHRARAEDFGGPWGGRGPGHHHGHDHDHGHERGHGHGPGFGPFGREIPPELGALRRDGMEVARLLRAAVLASRGNPERLTRLRAIVERTRGDLNEFLGQPEPAASSEGAAGGAAGTEPGAKRPLGESGPVEQV